MSRHHSIMFEISLFTLFASLFLIMNGLHSIDLYYNGHDTSYGDKTLSGEIIGMDKVYHNGVSQIMISLFLLIISYLMAIYAFIDS